MCGLVYALCLDIKNILLTVQITLYLKMYLFQFITTKGMLFHKYSFVCVSVRACVSECMCACVLVCVRACTGMHLFTEILVC